MGYKLLGFAVWHGAKFFVRRRYGHLAKPAAAGVVAAGIVAVAALGSRRSS